MSPLVGLLDPLNVKGITLRNRIVMPPMQSGRATFEGAVTNRLINYYTKRSTHIGLCIIEHAYISQTGKLSPKQLGIHNDTLIPGFEKLAKAIHETGTPAILQITHAGAVANQKVTGTTPAGPSATGKARELQPEELETLTEEFAQAATRAINAGFDGIELHGAHGYLLNQFFSPLMNKRTDEYGGTLENRMSFPLMVAKKVHETLNGKLLLYRLGADDLTPKGTQIQHSTAFAQKLENAGADLIDISGGMCGSEPKQLRHLNGYFVPQAHDIKKAVHIPVIGVGKITDANYADSLLKDGKVDLVAIGRALLKDAKWAEKAIETIKREGNAAS